MGASEADVSPRMPVSAQNNHVEAIELAYLIYFIDDIKWAIYGHGTSKRIIILHINYDQSFSSALSFVNAYIVSALLEFNFHFVRKRRWNRVLPTLLNLYAP